MKHRLTTKWTHNLEVLDIAFQPILNIHTGELFAVEALLRNYEKIGFSSIFDVFDDVYNENLLYTFDIAMREKAMQKFVNIKNYEEIKLFYNIDNRLLQMPNFSSGNTKKLLKKYNIKKENICFELSERHEIEDSNNFKNILQHYDDENYTIAIDDFGVGYSGYKLLYDTKPEYLKIDRFFLHNIDKDIKKKLMLKSITNLAIQLGIKIIAEGVETKEELFTCKNIGCHLIQGYLIQRPTQKTQEIISIYSDVNEIIQSDNRSDNNNSKIEKYIEKIESFQLKSKMCHVMDYFKQNRFISIIPVTNANHEPIGIIQEDQIKEFLYSAFGKSLLLNDGAKKFKVKHLLQACGVVDINSSISTIIELFSNNSESVGIIITKSSKYYGFLSARAIITIMNEENLLLAREQNPLTKLPGNMMIEKYLYDVTKFNSTYILCYFDLDNFKAFNDKYGFRNGDRVIQLFADIMRKYLPHNFNAHIGGDDFFTAIKCNVSDKEIHIKEINNVIKIFIDDVIQFYSPQDVERGYIISIDRDKNKKKFPLLTVSASLVVINEKTEDRSLKNINNILSAQKKVAKSAKDHIAVSTLF